MNVSRPIGVFDSGVGGLSILREIRRELPNEDLVYVADSGHAPYGERSEDFVAARSVAVVEFLLRCQAKAIVVACNTATGSAVMALRSRFPVPIVAIEPAVKPAVLATRSGVIGVLATRRTLCSENFQHLVRRHSAEVEILAQACPGLVERVEAGALNDDGTRTLLEHYVVPLLQKGADTLVLGCTHYLFLDPLLQELAGPAVTLVDPAMAVARQLRRRLEQHGIGTQADRPGKEEFWTSGSPIHARALISRLWGALVEVRELPTSFRDPGPRQEDRLTITGSECRLQAALPIHS
jgi:glutamate racemase